MLFSSSSTGVSSETGSSLILGFAQPEVVYPSGAKLTELRGEHVFDFQPVFLRQQIRGNASSRNSVTPKLLHQGMLYLINLLMDSTMYRDVDGAGMPRMYRLMDCRIHQVA